MDTDLIAQNLACVEGHFIAKQRMMSTQRLSCIQMTLSLKRPLSMASIGLFLERKP